MHYIEKIFHFNEQQIAHKYKTSTEWAAMRAAIANFPGQILILAGHWPFIGRYFAPCASVMILWILNTVS